MEEIEPPGTSIWQLSAARAPVSSRGALLISTRNVPCAQLWYINFVAGFSGRCGEQGNQAADLACMPDNLYE